MNDDGSVLSGDALKSYAKKRGLCHICAVTPTHQPLQGRVLKRLRRSQWQPLTVPCPQKEGAFLVYKGFCIQPTCYTLKQAKIVLGESTAARAFNESKERSFSSLVSSESSNGSISIGLHNPQHLQTTTRQPLRHSSAVMNRDNAFMELRDLNDETSPSPYSADDRKRPVQNNLPQASTSGKSKSLRGLRRSFWSSSSSLKTVSLGAKLKTYLDSVSQQNGNDSNSGSNLGSSMTLDLKRSEEPRVLDISYVKITSRNIPTLLRTFSQLSMHKNVPDALLLDQCGLGNRGLSKVVNGLINANVFVKGLSLRDNRLGKGGKAGIDALTPYITHHDNRLTDLNLSKNQISQESESVLFCALLPSQTIQSLNLARTKLWDVSLGAQHFYRTNQSLRVLNLEGNCLHDESVKKLTTALSENPTCLLETLLLANNAIGDKGLDAICDFLRTSRTLTKLSLAKNEITNVGASTLLNTLRNYQSCFAPLKEITGLAENNIADKSIVLNLVKQLETIYHNRLFVEEQQTHMGTITTGPTSRRTSTASKTSPGIVFEPAQQSNYPRRRKQQQTHTTSKANARDTQSDSPSSTRRSLTKESLLSEDELTSSALPKRIFVGGDSLMDMDQGLLSSPRRSSGVRRQKKSATPCRSKGESIATGPLKPSTDQLLSNWINRTYSSVSSMMGSVSSRSDQSSDLDSVSDMSSIGSWMENFSLVDPSDQYIIHPSTKSGIKGTPAQTSEEPHEQGIEIDLELFHSSLCGLGSISKHLSTVQTGWSPDENKWDDFGS